MPVGFPNLTFAVSLNLEASISCEKRVVMMIAWENLHTYMRPGTPLDYTSSWMRYLNGAATIFIKPMELEADISFRIFKSKTIISSRDMHFYDEMYEHLTMPEDFQKYINDHERGLHAASENRYRISRR